MSTVEPSLTIRDTTQRLRRDFGVTPSYQTLWRVLCEGAVEVSKARGRLTIRERDLPTLAAALGGRSAQQRAGER
jgi:hypothetical protein